MFKNRTDAATLLAEHLDQYKNQNALVLAIPRGGVPIGKVIADELSADLDVVLVHKLGHPNNPEYAYGAIDEDGVVYVDPTEDRHARIEKAELERLVSLRHKYTPLTQKIDPKRRVVIIVDDGVATGWTIKAAVAFLTRAKAQSIVVAVPVSPREAIESLREDHRISDVICLRTPLHFSAVGQFYEDFSQVSDEEVEQILTSHRSRHE
jgi:putative phosphoribosyl transferase